MLNRQIRAKLENTEHGWVVFLNSADRNGYKVRESFISWHCAQQYSQVIDADSVDFWSKDEDDLKLETEVFTYPPSFQILILSKQATAPSFVKIQFQVENNEFFLTLPLDLVSSSKSKSMT